MRGYARCLAMRDSRSRSCAPTAQRRSPVASCASCVARPIPADAPRVRGAPKRRSSARGPDVGFAGGVDHRSGLRSTVADVHLSCEHRPRDDGRVRSIVVDDASPEPLADALAGVSGVRFERNPENLGFIGTCNRAATLARGSTLVFLNNDTIVTPGWLDALLAVFVAHPDMLSRAAGADHRDRQGAGRGDAGQVQWRLERLGGTGLSRIRL